MLLFTSIAQGIILVSPSISDSSGKSATIWFKRSHHPPWWWCCPGSVFGSVWTRFPAELRCSWPACWHWSPCSPAWEQTFLPLRMWKCVYFPFRYFMTFARWRVWHTWFFPCRHWTYGWPAVWCSCSLPLGNSSWWKCSTFNINIKSIVYQKYCQWWV